MTVTVEWKGDMAFEASPPSGITFTLDAPSRDDIERKGPSPLEALLGSLAACGGMDVISILEKKRQIVTAYRVEVVGERSPAGSPYPRPFTAFHIRHFVSGENLDPAAVQRAVELSDEKYCSVISTLREKPEITSEWIVT